MNTIVIQVFLIYFTSAHILKKEHDSVLIDKHSEEHSMESSDFKFVPHRHFSRKTKQSVCISRSCVKLAALIIDYINETVDPCHDFYEFSCGGYIKKTKLPPGKSSLNAFSELNDILQEKLKDVLEAHLDEEDTRTTKMAKNLYKSCMNQTQIEELGLQPLRDILSQMGGWPVVEGTAWDEAKFNVVDALYKNHELGYSSNILFSFDVSPDERNSSYRVFQLDQPTLGLDREYLIHGIKDSDVKAYLNFSTEAAILLGADNVTARKEMMDVVLFEIKLANISKSRADRRNLTNLYHVVSIQELEELTAAIPWVKFFNFYLPSSVQIEEHEKVIVADPDFFRNLTVLMNNVTKRTMANYVLWRTVKSSALYLSKDIKYIKLHLNKNSPVSSSTWKECVKLVKDKLPIGMGNLYVKNFFDKNAKTKINVLVQYLRDQFDEILSTLDWMDEETRTRALEKSKAIHSRIGYPDELLMDDKLEEYYGDLFIDEGSLLNNILRINIHSMNYQAGLLREPVDKNDWKKQASVAVVNAYYYSLENSIKFPAGILQGIFFDTNFPEYVNFAGIGFVIGHEITHAFDDKGRQFDAEGNLKNWWNPETEIKFLEKAQCIINQYSNYTVPENGLKLNGILSQGEDIADNGGVKEAYLAYQKWVVDNGKEPRLPGLAYNTNQLFWIALALKDCSKTSSKYLKEQIMTDVHSPHRFRLNGPLSNSQNFANDFKCPIGSNMNPMHKCIVW